MHAYILIHSIHAHMYAYLIHVHTAWMQSPHAAIHLHNSSNTYTTLHISAYNPYKIHTHTLLALAHTCYTIP